MATAGITSDPVRKSSWVNNLFKEGDGKESNSKYRSPTLSPAGGGGYIDVINEYKWTGVPLGPAALAEIPYIYLTEYKSMRNSAALMTQAANSSDTVNMVADTDPYDSLFSHDNPSKFMYRFPFYTTTYYDLGNTFKSADPAAAAGDVLNNIGEAGKGASMLTGMGGFLGKLGRVGEVVNLGTKLISGGTKALEAGASTVNKLAGYAGGTGKLDVPQIWDTTSPRTVTFSFYLFNTYTVEDIAKNWQLVYLLRYQNTINKFSLITCMPPVFYEVMIPGQHYSKGMYISNLKIDNVGTSRLFSASEIGIPGNNANIPDAYNVSITLTDMLMPSQNLLNDMLNNQSVSSSVKGGK